MVVLLVGELELCHCDVYVYDCVQIITAGLTDILLCETRKTRARIRHVIPVHNFSLSSEFSPFFFDKVLFRGTSCITTCYDTIS